MREGNNPGKWAAVICFIFIAATIVWYVTGHWVSSDLSQTGKDLLAIANNPAAYLAHVASDIVYNLSIFLLGVLFYLMYNKTNQALAAFGALGFICVGIIWLYMDTGSLAQYALAKDYAGSTGTAAAAIANRAADLSLSYDYSTPITSLFYSMGFVSFGIMFIRRGALQRALGWYAVVVGIAMILTIIETFSGVIIGKVTFYLSEVWFWVTGVYLVSQWVKGKLDKTALET
jgi:hypothetical protein